MRDDEVEVDLVAAGLLEVITLFQRSWRRQNEGLKGSSLFPELENAIGLANLQQNVGPQNLRCGRGRPLRVHGECFAVAGPGLEQRIVVPRRRAWRAHVEEQAPGDAVRVRDRRVERFEDVFLRRLLCTRSGDAFVQTLQGVVRSLLSEGARRRCDQDAKNYEWEDAFHGILQSKR